MEAIVFSVSQITSYIKEIVAFAPILRSVYVRGEISNYKLHSSGHSYFTLKDEKAKIRCIMFKQYRQHAFDIEDGLDVIVKGYIDVYEREGQYQLYVEEIEPYGIGVLHLAFEQLKMRLQAEGLFDQSHKRPLPFFPYRVGIITSDSGAAIQDIINIARRRYSNIDLVLAPVMVQGKEAARQISDAINAFNNMSHPVDVIIMGRGGGSKEELWPFNEEIVARSIFASKIPIVSAVGHEVDFTISDFVADVRAPTPSAAAELVVPLKDELSRRLRENTERLIRAMSMIMNRSKLQLEELKKSRILRYPYKILFDRQQRLDELLRYISINIKHKFEMKKAVYDDLNHRLQAFNPLTALKRGYTITLYPENRNLIKSVKELSTNKTIRILYYDGQVMARVIDIEEGWWYDDRGEYDI